MNYKKNWLYFTFQSLKYAENTTHFKKIWRYYSHWQYYLNSERNSISDEQAWLTFDALNFLKSHLLPEHRVFEYGGGGSTLFFANRVSFVATVENDAQWFQLLAELIQSKGIKHWQGFFQEGEPVLITDSNREPQTPQSYMSNSVGQKNLSYEKYAKVILQFPEQYFDVVLVDGRARPSCMREAVSRIKAGGYLVVDNMERAYYHTAFNEEQAQLFDVVEDKRCPGPYYPGFTITKIWRKK